MTFQSSQWKCYIADYLLPFVRTPYILITDQYDRVQLNQLINGGDAHLLTSNLIDFNLLNQEQRDYAVQVATDTN